ncbi:MAG: hypothetical protein LH478_03450 [Chitinophagaceae bacterium]|nr:hypothetical protein [Chitinophagaceae bacterium]
MKNKKIFSLVILNSLTLLLMLFINYGSNAGLFYTVSVGDVSYKYDTLFTPAGYAFAIWGVIFLMLIAFTIFQWACLKNQAHQEYIELTGPWFTISNLANALWVYCWLNEKIGWSVIVILILLASLCVLTYKLRLELDDKPVKVILFVWWPIVIYLGWIMVATIACIAAWLVSTGWNGGPLSQQTWTIIMILVATLLYLYLVKTRNLREAAGVGIWAFIAIAARQWQANFNIAIIALICSLVLLITISIHGYKNRKYSIVSKLKEG